MRVLVLAGTNRERGDYLVFDDFDDCGYRLLLWKQDRGRFFLYDDSNQQLDVIVDLQLVFVVLCKVYYGIDVLLSLALVLRLGQSHFCKQLFLLLAALILWVLHSFSQMQGKNWLRRKLIIYNLNRPKRFLPLNNAMPLYSRKGINTLSQPIAWHFMIIPRSFLRSFVAQIPP